MCDNECDKKYQTPFTNVKFVCTNCGLIYDKEYRNPLIVERGTRKKGRPKKLCEISVMLRPKDVSRVAMLSPKDVSRTAMLSPKETINFPSILENIEEYNNLLKFINKKKLYLAHKTKIEMLFFNLFSLTKAI